MSSSYSPSFDSPDSLPYRVTFRYFTDYFRKTQPSLINSSSSALEEAFAAYKIDFYRRQLVNVFEDQKRYAWFKERYEPGKEAEEARKVTRDKGREGKMAVFLDKFGRGEWDDLCLDRAREFFGSLLVFLCDQKPNILLYTSAIQQKLSKRPRSRQAKMRRC